MSSPRACSSRLAARALATLAFAALGAAGCSSSPFSRIESTYDRMVNRVCTTCPAATGATTEAECRTTAAANDPFQGSQWDCQRGVYDQYPDEVGPYYDCVARAVSSFETCMNDAIRTCPPASSDTMACSDSLNAAIRACPLPDSIMASQALSACFSGP